MREITRNVGLGEFGKTWNTRMKSLDLGEQELGLFQHDSLVLLVYMIIHIFLYFHSPGYYCSFYSSL